MVVFQQEYLQRYWRSVRISGVPAPLLRHSLPIRDSFQEGREIHGETPGVQNTFHTDGRKPDFGMSILTTQQAAPFKDGTAFAQVGSETGKGFRDEKGAQRRRFGSRHALFPDQQAEKGVGGDQGQSVIHSDGGRPRRRRRVSRKVRTSSISETSSYRASGGSAPSLVYGRLSGSEKSGRNGNTASGRIPNRTAAGLPTGNNN